MNSHAPGHPRAEEHLIAEQSHLRMMARTLLAKECNSQRVRALADNGLPFDGKLWACLVDAGLTGIDIPIEYGGAGASFAELAVVLVEMGRQATVSPFLASAVLGSGAVLLSGTDAQRASWLPQLAAGSVRATAAVSGANGRTGPSQLGLVAERGRDGWQIDGAAAFVPDAHLADVLVLAASDPDGGVLLSLVEADRHGLRIVPTPTIDGTRKLATVHAEGLIIGPDAVLASGAPGAAALAALLDRVAVAVACDSLGVAERALEMTVGYAKDRVQFGRPIGSFQAVKHRCADMFIGVEAARALTTDAAGELARSTTACAAASAAKSYVTDMAVKVAGDALQLHGGIGYTWEHDMHILLKRAKLNQALFGSARDHRRQAADRILAVLSG